MIEIFNFAFGPYPQRVNIYLAEKQPESVAVTLYAEPNEREQTPTPEIRALTPTGSLPILRDADGTLVAQSLAILEYLEDRIPVPDMRGKTPAERAKVRQIVHVVDEALTFFGLWARHGSALGQGVVRSSREVADICSDRYFGQLRLIERLMSEDPFIAGEHVTLADCVAMATLQYTSDFYAVPIPPGCVKLQMWFDRFSQRPSARRPPYPEQLQCKAVGLMGQTGLLLG